MVHPIALCWQGVLDGEVGRNIVYSFWQHSLNLIYLYLELLPLCDLL